jgi:hypothetical protein
VHLECGVYRTALPRRSVPATLTRVLNDQTDSDSSVKRTSRRVSSMTISPRSFGLIVLALTLAGAQSVGAQTAHGQVYVTAGPGRIGDDGVTFVALGGEFIGRHGVGVAGEVSRISGVRFYYDPANFTRSTTMISGDLILPLARPGATSRVAPFALAGLAFMPDPLFDSYFAFAFGGGVNTRAAKHFGVRTDLRVLNGLSSKTTWIGTLGVVLR